MSRTRRWRRSRSRRGGGAVGIVHSPRTSKMMEDRAGKSKIPRGSRTLTQSFNGLREPVLSTSSGFLSLSIDQHRLAEQATSAKCKPYDGGWGMDDEAECPCKQDEVAYYYKDKWFDKALNHVPLIHAGRTMYKCFSSCSDLGAAMKDYEAPQWLKHDSRDQDWKPVCGQSLDFLNEALTDQAQSHGITGNSGTQCKWQQSASNSGDYECVETNPLTYVVK
ncbi:unnamed protein product [Amoebophrya sp. A120]|nr:unnamed protein product [Amoebophrya sp. A120]|eukprot:GSA120T00023817001.1